MIGAAVKLLMNALTGKDELSTPLLWDNTDEKSFETFSKITGFEEKTRRTYGCAVSERLSRKFIVYTRYCPGGSCSSTGTVSLSGPKY